MMAASAGRGESGESGDHGCCDSGPRRPAHASSSTPGKPIRSLRSPGCTNFWRARVKRGEADNRRSANAGIITGIVGILLAGAPIAFGVTILNSPVSQCNVPYVSGHRHA
jgi:hypothetical protein